MVQESGFNEDKKTAEEQEPLDIFSRLPKVKFIFDEAGKFVDYETPGPNPERGQRTSALGRVFWDSESHRRVFQVYDALMRCPTVYGMTHLGGHNEAYRSFQEAIASHDPRYVVGGGTEEECKSLIQSIVDWTNEHPQLFESYLKQVELDRDEGAFVIESIKEED
jgi:hypothetical protein